jgi:hypothetical protein
MSAKSSASNMRHPSWISARFGEGRRRAAPRDLRRCGENAVPRHDVAEGEWHFKVALGRVGTCDDEFRVDGSPGIGENMDETAALGKFGDRH